MKRLLITVLLLSGVVFAKGGGAGGPGGGGGAGAGGGQNQRLSQNQTEQRQSQTEQRQSPDPAQMVKKIMTSYDADKDGVLSLDELTQAMGEIQMNRMQKPAQGGQSAEPQDADKTAALMIEKYSSDQKGMTAGDLTKALKETARQR